MKSSYRFIDKNPVIDLIRTAFLDSVLSTQQIAERARISPGTIDNWLWGITKNPQCRTVSAVFDVLGIDTHYVYRSNGELLSVREGVKRTFSHKPKRGRLAAKKQAEEGLKVVAGGQRD